MDGVSLCQKDEDFGRQFHSLGQNGGSMDKREDEGSEKEELKLRVGPLMNLPTSFWQLTEII